MKRTEIIKGNAAVADELTGADLLSPLVLNRASNSQEPASFGHVLVGNLVGFRDDGRIPLVIFPGMIGSAAHPSRSLIDLNRVHIGKDIVLIFENADPTRPIVVGVIRNGEDSPEQQPGHVEIEGDGERLILSAKHELVLRCGTASITLTQSGKVFIQGSYVSSRSSTVNRIRGGSVQIN